MAEKINIVLTGVGGQGIITMATLIAKSALVAGLNAIVAETHGLSQRGGTVIVHVRIGSSVEAPLVPRGGADLLISLEPLEALRYLEYLKPGGTLIVNKYLIPPPLPGVEVPDPDTIIEALKTALKEGNVKIIAVNATEKAIEIGDARVANTYLIGLAIGSGALRGMLTLEHVEEAIRSTGKLVDKNLEALTRGYSDAKTLIE